jgi:O-6-methylguanine DNA methyltransferase
LFKEEASILSETIMNALNLALDKSGQNWFGVVTDQDNLLLTSAFGQSRNALEGYLTSYVQRFDGRKPSRNEHLFAEYMSDLFSGRKPPTSLKFNYEHTLPFQQKVVKIMRLIPTSKVTTYGLIAKKIGSGPRAVGNAVASNPWPLFVPCHRVVSSTLLIGNYSMCGALGDAGTVAKRQLLEHEKVPFNGDKVDPSAIWDASGD